MSLKQFKSWLLVRATMIAALVSVVINVNAADKFYLSDFSIKAGETKQLAIQFESDKVSSSDPTQLEYVAFQFDLYLPDGLTIEKKKGKYNFTFNTDRADDHTFTSADLGDGAIRVIAASLSNGYFWEKTGDFVYFAVTASADYSGNKEIVIKNVMFSTKAGERTELPIVVTNVKSEMPVNGIVLDKTSVELLEGETITLKATVSPDNATDKTVTWSTSDSTIATVDNNGLVKAINVGKVTITAKVGEKTATCEVTVKPVPVSGIVLDKTSVELLEGESITLTAIVSPNATDKTVIWSTSDSTIATVDNGIVEAIKVGKVIITAMAGEETATCDITVKPIPAEDIVVNVPEGDIAAAVEAEKAKVAKVGKITINLTEGAAYTVNSSIVAPAALVINGNGATIDASALDANMITTDAAEPAEWVTIDSVAVKDVTVKGLGKALFYSAIKNRNIQNFVVDNSVVEVAKDVVVFDFTKGSVAMNFTIKNSTLYAPTATTKSIYSSQSAQKGSDAGATADAPQTLAFENTTLYNLTYNRNLFTHRSASQTWMKYVVKNNIVVNTGKANFMTTINQGQDNKNPQYEVTTNSVGTLVDGVYTDLSESQLVQGNVMGTLVTSDPMFKDVANGDFTLGEASEQNTNKLGDPRWFAAAPAPSVAYLCGSKTAPDEAIYNALVAAQYDVTPLNYDDVTLTEEIVMNDFAGKYDVVVLAGATGSGTNLAKSANILLGKVNVLSTKSFWYKHYGTNGGNPGTADAPSLSVAVSEGYAEHPLFTGIDGAEFAVFNDIGKSTGRYLQSNGSFADEAYAQTTIATTLGADCIGEAWAGDYGYVIIPVDGAQPEGYLTEDGKKLFVNAVQYLIDGVKFNTGIDGINSNVNVQNGDVYSINGIKVRKAGESLKGLAKGFYIVNGKKFIVK